MRKKFPLWLTCCILLLPGSALADAGSALRTYKDTTALEPGKQLPEKVQVIDSDSAQAVNQPVTDGPTVHISHFNVVGNTVLSGYELREVLTPYVNRSLSTKEIHDAADQLMQAIRSTGAFTAKVYILPQDLIDNTVTFNIIEGHLSENGIILGHSSERVKDRVLLDQLQHTLKPGSIITADKYERAIYLTNDLPGIAGSENLLFPAENVGEAGFELIPEDEKLLTGNAYYDNFGSYFTGRNRWGTTLEFNSPYGYGEKMIVGANVSEYGTIFGYFDINLPLYPNGLRGGATLDYLDYKTEEVNDLQGNAFDGSIYVTYPIVRSRLSNLYSELYYTYTDLKDEDDIETITKRSLHVGSIRFYGDKSDSFMGGGVTSAIIEGYFGSVDLDGYQPFEEYDAEHANTQGGFSRATLNLNRIQHLIGNLQAYFAFNGQISSKNMDPSQSIAFGGPYDFPGYHAGEIFGDEGWMVHGDLRYNFRSLPWQGNLQLTAFYDYGWIQTHTVAIVDGFAVPGSVDRSFYMQSAGFGLSQTWDHLTIEGVIGWQINNEIPDELLDDGGDNSVQGWVHLVYNF